MNMQNLFNRILFICFIFSPLFSQCSFSYTSTTKTVRQEIKDPKGFAIGTLVKTPQGYTPIEQLKVGDEVVCFDNQSKCTTSKITAVHTLVEPKLAILQAGSETIRCHPMQKFCCLNAEKKFQWLPAHEVDHKSILNCGNGNLSISCNLLYFDKIEVRPGDHTTFTCDRIYNGNFIENQTFYDLEVENYHNFCITKNDIIVHNSEFIILLTYLFENGFEFWAAGAILAYLGFNLLFGEEAK